MKPRDLLLTRRHSLAVLWAYGSVRAQGAYPSRPITLIVPFGAGGIADLTARAVAKEMSVSLRQPIVIDNRPSAGAIVGAHCGGARRARRPHGVAAEQCQRGECRAVSQAAVRCAARLRARHDDRLLRSGAVRRARLAVAQREGDDCAGQGETGPVDVRHHRQRQHTAPGRRVVQVDGAGRRGGGALQEHAGGGDGAARGRGESGDRDPRPDAAATERRGRARVGRHVGSSLRRLARRSHGAGVRPARLRCRLLERAGRAGAHAGTGDSAIAGRGPRSACLAVGARPAASVGRARARWLARTSCAACWPARFSAGRG